MVAALNVCVFGCGSCSAGAVASGTVVDCVCTPSVAVGDVDVDVGVNGRGVTQADIPISSAIAATAEYDADVLISE